MPRIGEIAQYKEGARAYHSAHQSIPNATPTTLAFNGERWDTDSIHHLTVNNSRLTCRTAGKYIVIAMLKWAGNATGHREVYLRHSALWSVAKEYRWSLPAYSFGMTISTLIDLAINDFMEVQVYQNSGDGLNILYEARWGPVFAMSRVGA